MDPAKTTLAIMLICSAASLAACSSSLAPPPPVVAPVESTLPPPAAGVLDGPVGLSLQEADRATAVTAQLDAVSSGMRKSWRGSRGVYGFVIPGPENGECREYTHKIFTNGRPKEAKGRACMENGEWRVGNSQAASF